MLDFRTDLADERTSLYKKANKLDGKIDGIETQEEKISDEIKVTRVKVLNNVGQEAIGKKKGTYVTIDITNLQVARPDDIQNAARILTKELKKLIEPLVDDKGPILVVGLGNQFVTPDSLGPKVTNEVDVTRHFLNYSPEVLPKDTRPVSAIAPGVLGTTGIETLEILQGIVSNIHPSLIIAIDALASRSLDRIIRTVQLSDTGIIPGAGVDNKRKELSIETLNIPVIAIGVPTVVEAATIAADSIDIMIKKLEDVLNIHSTKQIRDVYEAFENIKEENKYLLIKEALANTEYNLVVTPKEIDELIENMKDVIARGINFAVQK